MEKWRRGVEKGSSGEEEKRRGEVIGFVSRIWVVGQAGIGFVSYFWVVVRGGETVDWVRFA